MSSSIASTIKSEGRRHYKVLLVDDDEMDREYFSSLLSLNQEYEFRSDMASSLKEAREMLFGHESDYDCILLDYMLGDGTGEQFLKELRVRPHTPAVIVFTSFSDPKKAIQLLELGAHDYLDKRSINPQMLSRVIRFGVARSRLNQAENVMQNDKRVLQMQSDFINVLSDELGSPIEQIRTATHTMREKGGAEILPFIPQMDRIDDSVDRMDNIITRSKECTLFDAGTVEMKLQPFHLHSYLKKAAAQYQVEYPNKPFKLMCSLPAVPDILADPALCIEAVENVLENAYKYSDETSTISVKIALSSRQMMVHIRDRGIGIPPEDLPHIGDKFFRASNVTSSTGAGMGLYLTKQIMELMHAHFSIQSDAGLGTVVTLSFPLAVIN